MKNMKNVTLTYVDLRLLIATVGFALAWRLVDVFTSTSRWCKAYLTGVENYLKALILGMGYIYLKMWIFFSNIFRYPGFKGLGEIWVEELFRLFSTGNSSISCRVFQCPTAPQRLAQIITKNLCLLYRGGREEEGGCWIIFSFGWNCSTWLV